jgi:hypothetical protein
MNDRARAELLLTRLSNVRVSGRGWRADCPIGHRSRGALAVNESSDGRLLIHCHAGCAANDVLGAVQLSLADLYPERLRDDSTEGRRAARQQFRQAAWGAALGVLDREALVPAVAAQALLRGESLTSSDVERLQLSCTLLHDAYEVLCHG